MSQQQYFTSQKNYLKRAPVSGSASVSAPSTLTGSYFYRTTFTVAHNLGYIPQVRVYYEASASDGKVYPAGGNRTAGTYLGLASNSIYCLWKVDENNLTIYLESAVTQTGSRTVYWVVYLDTV